MGLIGHHPDTVDAWRLIITGSEIDHSSSNYKNIRLKYMANLLASWKCRQLPIKAILHQSIRWLFSFIVFSSIFTDHYSDVIMSTMACQITVSIVYSTVCSGADQRSPQISGLCERNSPVTGEFPPQRASNAETVFIWWRHHVYLQRLSQRGRNFPTTLWYRALAGGMDIRKQCKSFQNLIHRRLLDNNMKIVICYAEAWNVFFIILYYCHVMYVTSTKKIQISSSYVLSCYLHGYAFKDQCILYLTKRGCNSYILWYFFFEESMHEIFTFTRRFGRSMGCLLWVQRLDQLRPLSLSTWGPRLSTKVLSYQYRNSNLWI